MFLIKVSIILVFGLFSLISAQTQCEFTDYNNVNGFCTTDQRCCNGFSVNNLCSNGAVCCYGKYDSTCSSNSNSNANTSANSCPAIISRNSWKARNPSKALTTIAPVSHVFIHHTDDGNTCNDQNSCSLRVRALQSKHILTKGWDDIAWNFIIGGDGKVYEGIGWNKEGFHTLNWNDKSLGIALIGDYDIETPRDGMLQALQDLISCGVSKGYILNDYQLHGHRDAVPATKCPGDSVYNSITSMPNFESGPLNPNN